MIVFSNTTPLIALSGIGRLDLLPELFKRVYVTDAVAEECEAGGKVLVPKLRDSAWIELVDTSGYEDDMRLMNLDKGEKYTILAALEREADYVLIDEKTGRNVAEYLGLNVTGTLGVLLKAKQIGKIDSFSGCVREMKNNGIHFNEKLLVKLADVVGEVFKDDDKNGIAF